MSNWSNRMRQSLGAVYGDDLQHIWSRYCDGFQTHFRVGGQVCRHLLRHIECPTLILHGGFDAIVPDFHPRIFHEEIRNSRLHLFPEGRHNIHLALAREFNPIVSGFLLDR